MAMHGKSFLSRVWSRVHEPRAIAVLQACVYLTLLLGGLTVFHTAPQSVEGEIGAVSMMVLATMITVSTTLGIPAALFGWQWLERIISAGIIMSAGLYGWIIVSLQIAGSGNRFLQLSFVIAAILHQVIRLVRIAGPPYNRDLAITTPHA